MKKRLIPLLCLMLALLPISTLADTTLYVTSNNGGGVHLRSGPSTEDEVLITVPYGAAVDVLDIQGNNSWANVIYEGLNGYMMWQYLTSTPPGPPAPNPTPIPAPTYAPTAPPAPTYVPTNPPAPTYVPTNPPAPTYVPTDPPAPTYAPTAPPAPTYVPTNPPAPTYVPTNPPAPTYAPTAPPYPNPPPNPIPYPDGGETYLEAALSEIFSGFATTGYGALVVPSTPSTYVNLRWAPTESAPVRAQYWAGATLTVLTQNGTWSEVFDYETSTHGFMMSEFLTPFYGQGAESTTGQVIRLDEPDS